MTDDFEDRLRRHLTDRAATVYAEPDPSGFVEHSVGRSHRPGLVAGGIAALTMLVAGAGVLTGVNLAGAGATAQSSNSAPTSTLPGRAGAALAPAGPESSVPPSIVVQTPYSLLFTRVSTSGVTVRAYSTGTGSGGCPASVSCSPSTTVPAAPPCPADARCAEPLVVPHTTTGGSGTSGASAGSTTATGSGTVTTAVPPVASGGPGSVGSAPPATATTCGQLVLELSTDRAVGTGSVAQPNAAAPTPDTVQILGTGSFGTAEGAPVSWIAVWAGGGVASVQLSVGGNVVDAMAPNDGVVVLAVPGGSGLAGASVTGLDPGGSTLATVPATQGVPPSEADGCPASTGTPPSPVPTPTPIPTPTTTVPTDLPPTTTTTTTGPGVGTPGPNQPVTPQGA
jgi:hypothetical protein